MTHHFFELGNAIVKFNNQKRKILEPHTYGIRFMVAAVNIGAPPSPVVTLSPMLGTVPNCSVGSRRVTQANLPFAARLMS